MKVVERLSASWRLATCAILFSTFQLATNTSRAVDQIDPACERIEDCEECVEPGIELIGASAGLINLQINTSQSSMPTVSFRVHSKCGTCFAWSDTNGAYVELDQGADVVDTDNDGILDTPFRAFLPGSVAGASGSEFTVEIPEMSDDGVSLFQLSCQHTLRVVGWAHRAINSCDNDAFALVRTDPITIWINGTQASCRNGAPSCERGTYGLPVDVATGTMFHEMLDLRVKGPMNIDLHRRFDSTSTYPGALGRGWQHDGMVRLENATSQSRKILVDEHMRRIPFICRRTDNADHHSTCLEWAPDPIDHLTLEAGTTYPWRVTDKHGTSHSFDSAGRLKQVMNRTGWTITYHHDVTSGDLDEITDSFGRVITLSYYGSTHILATASAGSRTVTYHYSTDSPPNLTSVELADGSTVTYEYNDPNETSTPKRHLTKVLDTEGRVIESHEYTGERVTHTESEGENSLYDFQYSGDPSTETSVRNGRGQTTVLEIDAFKGVPTARTGGPGCSSCGGPGDTASTVYDEFVRPTILTDGRGVKTRLTYDSMGNVLTRTEDYQGSLERTTTFEYDPTINFGLNLVTKISVPTLGTGDCAEDHPNKEILKTYDAYGNLHTETTAGCNGPDFVQATTTYTWTGEGLISTVAGPREEFTAFHYYIEGDNDFGRLWYTENQLGQTVTFAEYDDSGNAQVVTDPNGVETHYSFDPMGRTTEARVTCSTCGDDLITGYHYDTVGDLDMVRRPKCVAAGTSCEFSENYSYDPVHRLTEIRDALGNKIISTYDSEGNRLREEYRDSSDLVTRFTNFTYDAFNRPKFSYFNDTPVPPDDDSTFFQRKYFADGTVEWEEDPLGHRTSYTYDSLKRLKTSSRTVGTDPVTTAYGYDSQDNLIKITDPKGLETDYSYGDLGWRLSTASPDTGTTTYEYDVAGNLTRTTDANGVIVERTYDELNRLTSITYPDTSLNVTFEYDSLDVPFGIGRKTGMVDLSGTTLYSYDRRGLLTSEDKEIDGLVFVTGYDYDKNGNLTELRYPSIDPARRQGAVDYQYDDADRIINVSMLYNDEPIDLASDIQYKPFGPRNSTALGNTLIDARTFDTRYQSDTWDLVNQSSEHLLHYSYGFNKDGNLETVTANVDPPSPSNRTFDYDEIHRLTSATGPWCTGANCTACTGKTYTYDKNGNRLCSSESGSAVNYTYASASNRLATAGAASYGYDDNGNITTDGAHSYDYNDANRLAVVNGATSYDYDGENRRVRKVGTQTTYFFDDPSGRILTELRINSEVYGGAVYGKDYVYLPEGPIARVDWSDIPNPNYYPCRQSPEVICPPPRVAIADLSYYHTDHLGTPLAMTDQNGELAWQAEYLPFGELFSNEISTAGNNLRFPGQYFDSETGLHQNWFRDYDPKTGRYVEADPIGLEVGTNLFSYVYANPGSFLDLDGLCPCGLPEDVIWAAWSDTKDWSKAADRTDVNPGFPSGTYKCNLFADASYEKTGYHLPNIGGGLFARLFGKYPPGAQSLSDPSYSVPGWPLVSGPAQPGDLLAFQGHVAIATMPGHSVSASPDGVVANDWGFRRGQTPVIRRCKCP